MPTVTLRFSPMAEHVRTARLVAVSVARRAGFGEDQLDEIRIAIGEACARAVAGGVLAAPPARRSPSWTCGCATTTTASTSP